MKIIAIDFGNSNPHFAIYENDKLVSVDSFSKYDSNNKEIVIVSSVKKSFPYRFDFNLSDYKKDQKFFDMPFEYSDTLGIDRLVTGYGVYLNQINKNKTFETIVIDAGTFITIDTINETGFRGGFIFPGIKTFLESYKKGELLPTLHSFQVQEKNSLPHTTEEAILGAVQIYLIGILSEILKKPSPCNIVITGGSSEIIYKIILKLNLEIELKLDLHFLLNSIQLIHSRHLKE